MARSHHALSVALLSAGCLTSQGTRPSLELGLLGATQYNRRGMVENEHGVLQGEAKARVPAGSLGGALQLKAWSNMDLTDDTGDAWFPDGHAGEPTEIDLTAAYGRSLGPIDLSAGVTGYIHPFGSEFLNGNRGNTTEVFAAAGGEVLPGRAFGFYPLFAAFYDPDAVDGFYLNGGVFKGWDLAERLRLLLGASVGYSEQNHSLWTYGFRERGWADLRGTLTLEYRLTESSTIAAGVAASTILDDDIHDWVEDRAVVARRSGGAVERGIDPEAVWGTLGVSWRI